MNLRTVCFFMLYHGRPELTRMSMWHMAKVIKKFNKAGHQSIGIVVGDDFKQAEYAESLGLEHMYMANDPLDKKFSFTWTQALLKETDYVCWLGSNNLHSDAYWNRCIKVLEGEKQVSFGSNKFSIVHASKKVEPTCTFTTRKNIHLCSAGQFYLNWSLSNAVNFRSVYAEGQTFNFDGKINQALAGKWGDDVIKTISSDPSDCLDIKNDENIHSYHSYIRKRGKVYPAHKDRSKLVEQFEELKMLDNGQFKAL